MATGQAEGGAPTASRRRLAAILAADVAGYARLVGADEEDTLARLRALFREVAQPTVAAHHGRVFKLMGDAFLAEFPSAAVAEAVRGRVPSALEDIGERALKNVERPVRAFRLGAADSAPAPKSQEPAERPRLALPDRPS